MGIVIELATRQHRQSRAATEAGTVRDFWLVSTEVALMALEYEVDRGGRNTVRAAVADVRTAWEGFIATLREQRILEGEEPQ